MSSKSNSSKRVHGGTKISMTCRYMSPVKYLKHVGGWMVAVFCFVAPQKRGSTKVSSSGTPKRISVSPIDSQRAEAIKDCIDFINSSSSSTGSNSTPKSCHSYLTRGTSLSVENKDQLLVSSDGLFTAGFHQVGVNAYAFAVWFSEQTTPGEGRMVVWMANRDTPVNGKQSKLSLSENGNLVLTDAGDFIIWSTNTKSMTAEVLLQLQNTGNLVLHEGKDSEMPLWQSFDHPTDTLLPGQPFTKFTQLVSSRSSTNYSSGLYKLFFDNDSILRLLYDGPETTSVYWPHPSFRVWEVGRLQYIFSRLALLDFYGEFNSSDGFRFKAADFGTTRQRIMKLDIDGNIRVYSLVKHGRWVKWEVQWQAIQHSCLIHGTCGPNSLCTYSHDSGSKCVCLHGFKMVNSLDWRYGCEPEFHLCMQEDDCGFDFIKLPHAQFYGYDIRLLPNYTLNACKKYCLQDTSCKGFQYGWLPEKGFYYCFIKNALYNGIQLGIDDPMYVKLPRRLVSSFYQQTAIKSSFSCPPRPVQTPIVRFYDRKHHLKLLDFLLLLGCTIGIIEITCIVFFWYCTSRITNITKQNYFPVTTGFRKFTYRELKKASKNFSEEIGRGGACIVYKGRVKENKLVAIKRLKNTNHQSGSEVEFQAEISTIGKVNHMNLIETLGFCAEGKHRLVVYEYMENGSLADNLGVGKLNWDTMFDIAKGTAKGLAYLHEECLEWVLHCDVKPHNILLDANYNPKVADFGLSKLYDRGGHNQSDFSMIRGTRGYMAPEWAFNLRITSKVDVYSYGVVILEMITGKGPAAVHQTSNESDETKLALIDWVRLKTQRSTESWVEEIVGPSNSSEYDRERMENLVRVALQCVEEDREARPSMSQVVNMINHL
uniref:putative receptor protein kinase ZmPK1 n=1 Tax=Erigeron canadensis TaxID=72917 RepID=UPI001CB8FD13|nr:putative receptor protein kinase ZmPK1 [Erigeron canadensis]